MIEVKFVINDPQIKGAIASCRVFILKENTNVAEEQILELIYDFLQNDLVQKASKLPMIQGKVAAIFRRK